MSNDYTLPPVPQAFFDEFGKSAYDIVMDYGHACAEHVRAEITPRVVEILKERDAALARIAELKAQNAGLLDQHARDSKELRALCEQRDEYLVASRRLQADKRALLQGHEEQASEISRLRADLAAKDARIAELEAEGKRIARICDDRAGIIDGLREYLRDFEGDRDRLRTEVEALRACLSECADDLAAEVSARSSGELPRRIERDLEPVCKSRALLAQPAGSWVNPLAAEVEDWRKLLDPVNLHVNLLKGKPAQLTKAQLAHLLGQDYTALLAEVEKYRADAERYRAWRHAFREGECGVYNAICNAESESEHDAAIDAAIAARKGEGVAGA